MGDAPSRYGPQLGGGTFLPRLALGELYLERGEAAQARTELQRCVDHHPEFLAVAGPYVLALLRDGVAPAEVMARLEDLDGLPAAVRLTVAAALQRAGAVAEAEQQYRLALAATPGNARARTSLGELLLGRGAWDEAVEQASQVPADDPCAGLAVRIELCGLIGRAGHEHVQAALARATVAGLSSAERAVSPPGPRSPTAQPRPSRCPWPAHRYWASSWRRSCARRRRALRRPAARAPSARPAPP